MNTTLPITRDRIITALVEALQPLDYTHALWQGGAAAFGRVDEWSDIDLLLVVADEQVEAAFGVIDATLERIAPIELKYRVPQPTWHGLDQTFYRLQGSSPYLVIDFAVMRLSNPNKFLEPEMHGRPVVHFDKSGVVQPPETDLAAHAALLRRRQETLRLVFDLFQSLTLKELNRGNLIEALSFYHAFTLRPLVEALRIQHAPGRYNFHTRYLQYDLPPADVARLQELYFVRDGQDLAAKRAQAEEWFHEISNAGLVRP